MDLVNTYEHRISTTVDGDHIVVKPGPFTAKSGAADKFLAMPGVVRDDSDEGKAWLAAHPGVLPTDGEGTNMARRERAAAFGADARGDMAKRNREVIGDDAAPGGPASGVVTAGGERPLSPALQTTETEADALRGGVDLSDEPPVGPVGHTAETVGDAMPGSLPEGMPVPPVLSRPVPRLGGVQVEDDHGDDVDELKGEALEEAALALGVDTDSGGSKQDGGLTADETRAAIREKRAEAAALEAGEAPQA